jgi:hypothetical protein
MNTRLAGLMGLFVLTSGLGAKAQVVSDKVQDIRVVSQQIEADSSLRKVTLGKEEFLGEEAPDKGASLNGFFRGDTLCKMNVWIGLSYGVMQEHYYFSNGQLVYVYETEDDYPAKDKSTHTFEAHYYFDRDNAIQKLTNGKRKMGADDPHHYLELYHNAHYYAGLLIKKRRVAAAHQPAPQPPAPARTT